MKLGKIYCLLIDDICDSSIVAQDRKSNFHRSMRTMIRLPLFMCSSWKLVMFRVKRGVCHHEMLSTNFASPPELCTKKFL